MQAQGRSSFFGDRSVDKEVKAFKTYDEQVDLLLSRGMEVEDRDAAIQKLRTVNYYRLSGYWYPFRRIEGGVRTDSFYPGTNFDDVVALYEFDSQLRAATFTALMPIELAIRALVGHELGRVDPLAHLNPAKLGPLARRGDQYARWLEKHEREIAESREDFVAHHQSDYGGRLPVWVAVEILDWGALAYLYSFAPQAVQWTVADACELRPPQLGSWLKTLNLVRNTCAHHGRLYNRVHTITPKLPQVGVHPDLDAVQTDWARTFGQLTLIQFMADRLGVGRSRLLPAVLRRFPVVKGLPPSHMGLPPDWESSSALWK